MNLRLVCGLVALLLVSVSGFADCIDDWERGNRRIAAGQPFDAEHLRRMPASAILLRQSDQTYLESLQGKTDAKQQQARLPAGPRHLLALAPLVRIWFDNRDSAEFLRVTFQGGIGDEAPEMLAALQAIGADKQATAFRTAMQSFGSPYPRDASRRSERFSKWGAPPNAFTQRINAAGEAFGSRAEFFAALGAFACKTSEATAWLDQARAALSDDDRVAWISDQLAVGFLIDGNAEAVKQALEAIPQPYRTIYLIRLVDGEVTNGGVQQFFFNHSGAIAPYVPAALRDVGLTGHADIIARGLAMFPQPYLTETAARRAQNFSKVDPKTGERWTAFDEALGLLTDTWEYAPVFPAAVRFMRGQGAIPE